MSKDSVKAAADRAEKTAKGEPVEAPKAEIDPTIVMAEEIKAKIGRPTKYKVEYAAVAAALCKRGATDFELAEEFGVSTSTIWRWSVQHDDFWSAIHTAKGAWDDRIERSVAQRAAGYTYHSEKVFMFQGEVVRASIVEHVPADMGAAKMWLTNRRPDKWREISKVEHGAPGDFDQMSDEELSQYIESERLALLEAQKSGRAKTSTKH